MVVVKFMVVVFVVVAELISITFGKEIGFPKLVLINVYSWDTLLSPIFIIYRLSLFTNNEKLKTNSARTYQPAVREHH